jgi:hypothetical protein
LIVSYRLTGYIRHKLLTHVKRSIFFSRYCLLHILRWHCITLFFIDLGLIYFWLYFGDAYCPNHMSKETSSFTLLSSSHSQMTLYHTFFTNLGLIYFWCILVMHIVLTTCQKKRLHSRYYLLDALYVIFHPLTY